jgi:pilus assembly protein CpaF
MGNIIALVVVSLLAGGGTFFFYNKRASGVAENWGTTGNSLDFLIKEVLRDCTEMVKIDKGLIYKGEEYEASRRNKERVEKALKQCVYGEANAREVVLAVMREIISRYLPTLEDCNSVLDTTNLRGTLEPEQKFEVLIYYLQEEHGKNALKHLYNLYNFGDEREMREGVFRRELDDKLLDKMFDEVLPYNELEYDQALDIITLFIYQRTKGFGIVVDTLRTLNIDGMELGTSGSIQHKLLGTNPDYVITKSCWIQISAKWIHLSFVDFKTQEELRRLINNMSNVEGSEALSVKNPLKVVDSYNGDRVTVIRGGVGATYGIFIRSFSAGVVSVRDWLNKPDIYNWQLVEKLLFFLSQCSQNMGVTGQQNTGKTTLMKGLIGFYPMVNIRVLEMSFELNLNEIYPERNVFCTKPSVSASASDIQSQLKKSDGFVSLVGEVATDDVAANMIQFGLVASACTLFSHHGVDYKGLIDGLMGSLLASGVYSDEGAAQSVVLDVVKHNVHLDFHGYNRVVDYVEEIVKGERIIPYPELHKSTDVVEALDQLTSMNREYYQRSTDRINYTSRKIIVFDKRTNTYRPNQWYSPERFESMLKNMPEHLRADFLDFYEENWGRRLRSCVNSEYSVS